MSKKRQQASDVNCKPIVAIGLLATQRDETISPWRPSIALCQTPDKLPISRFELLYQKHHRELAEQVKGDIQVVSPQTRVNLHPWHVNDPWDIEEVYGLLHAFARSYSFQTEKEDYLIHLSTGTHVMQICLFLLVARRYLPGRLINTIPPEMKKGSFKISDINLASYDRIVEGLRRERQEQANVLAGQVRWGKKFQSLLEDVVTAAGNCMAPVLLTGPTGSGKSFLARHIYEMKKDRNLVDGQLIEVNCATLRKEIACSDLFGHVKGAFTGAGKTREGLIAKADKGILFLDEISELELEAQAMLLTALDTGRYLPVGSDEYRQGKFELITATNRELQNEVRAGRFREDLYHRISVLQFDLPGLDRRREDIEPFVDFALNECSRELYEVRVQMAPAARVDFLAFAASADWPGNLRQVKQAVLRMAARADSGRITRHDVRRVVTALRADQEKSEQGDDDLLLASLLPTDELEALDKVDRVQLAYVVRTCRRSPSLAAAGRFLFDKSRKKKKTSNDSHRLAQLLQKYGLEWARIRSTSPDEWQAATDV